MIVGHILDLDSRGFAPSLGAIRDIADKLLTERGAGQVGQRWPYNFVNQTDSLTTRFNRPYNRQRALCEDPKAIRAWFKLIARTRATYGIQDEDTYNFNETGFIMGVAATLKVITSSNTIGRAVVI